jgi:hypothetical protein
MKVHQFPELTPSAAAKQTLLARGVPLSDIALVGFGDQPGQYVVQSTLEYGRMTDGTLDGTGFVIEGALLYTFFHQLFVLRDVGIENAP